MQLRLKEIADLVGGTLSGDPGLSISGVKPLSTAGPQELSWIDKLTVEIRSKLGSIRAGAVLVPPGFERGVLPCVVECENPGQAIGRVLTRFYVPPRAPEGIHPTAIISPDANIDETAVAGPYVVVEQGAVIGRNTILDAGVFIGEGAKIGNDCRLYQGVIVLRKVSVGNRVIIHPGAVIGADGFGYRPTETGLSWVPHIGTVRIEDNVEIGAGSCVDRAKCGETVICEGSKLDNLVQIAHNVVVGRHCALAAQVGVAGSTEIGEGVMIGGQAGLADHLKVGSGAKIAAGSGVMRDVQDEAIMMGTPALTRKEMYIQYRTSFHLPGLLDRVRALEERLKKLEGA